MSASKAVGEVVRQRVIVFGGNGFVGRRISQVALSKGYEVVVACRSGAITVGGGAWTKNVICESIDATDRSAVYDFLDEYSHDGNTKAVVSSIGLLTRDHIQARRINGDPTLNIAAALYEKKMPSLNRMVFVSAADLQPANKFLHGYYHGKRSAEKAMRTFLPQSKIAILRPGMIYGSRPLENGFSVPLGLIGAPLEMINRPLQSVIPLSILTPPVSVDTLAQAAVYSCGEEGENGTFEYKDICRLAKRLM